MIISAIHTPLLAQHDQLAEFIADAGVTDGAIVVVSSKAVATVEGRRMDLSSFDPTEAANKAARVTGLPPAFAEAILQETVRLNGTVRGMCTGAILTEVVPEGLENGSIFAANAGLDRSNTPAGTAIGWPIDPPSSAERLERAILERSGCSVGIIISDSCCMPRRIGVTAYALTVSGFDPFESQIGATDLFSTRLMITVEARADQLAVAANFVMGNAAQSCPAAILRDHGLRLAPFSGWVPGMDRGRDLFSSLFAHSV